MRCYRCNKWCDYNGQFVWINTLNKYKIICNNCVKETDTTGPIDSKTYCSIMGGI